MQLMQVGWLVSLLLIRFNVAWPLLKEDFIQFSKYLACMIVNLKIFVDTFEDFESLGG